jgi:hypothetical protein
MKTRFLDAVTVAAITLLLAFVALGRARPAAAKDVEQDVVLRVVAAEGGRFYVEPMFTPQFSVRRIAGDGTLAPGEAVRCRAFNRVRGVVRAEGAADVSHELVFRCGEGLWSVEGVNLDQRTSGEPRR